MAAIREFQPKELFFAVDGPRNSEEEHIVQQVRNVVMEIDWDCEIHKRFSSVNKGCKQGVFDAIDWFFEEVPQGVILEDDCIPSLSFLNFCEEMLDYFKEDQRIYSICGTNHGLRSEHDSYYFSTFFQAWGWATWRRAWRGFDVNLKSWESFRKQFEVRDFMCSEMEAERQTNNFNLVSKGDLDTWDYSWNFHVLMNHGLNVISNNNGVINIGHDDEATHTNVTDGSELYNQYDTFPEEVIHPKFIVPNRSLERMYGSLKFGFPLDGVKRAEPINDKPSIFERSILKLKTLLRQIFGLI